MKLFLQCQRSREVKLGQKCHEDSISFSWSKLSHSANEETRQTAIDVVYRAVIDGRRWLVTKTDFIVESCHILSPIKVQTLEERAPEEVYLATTSNLLPLLI